MHYGLGENGLWNKVSCDIVHFLPLLCVYPCQACPNNTGHKFLPFYVFCSSTKSLKAPTHVRVENLLSAEKSPWLSQARRATKLTSNFEINDDFKDVFALY